MRPRKRLAMGDQGFTLLEVLAATLVFTIGFVILSQALSTGMLASTDVENVDLALNITQARMEEIKNTSFAGIVSSSPAADSNFPNFMVTTTVTGTDPKQIAVTAAWNVKGGQTSVNLTTLRANY